MSRFVANATRAPRGFIAQVIVAETRCVVVRAACVFATIEDAITWARAACVALASGVPLPPMPASGVKAASLVRGAVVFNILDSRNARARARKRFALAALRRRIAAWYCPHHFPLASR